MRPSLKVGKLVIFRSVFRPNRKRKEEPFAIDGKLAKILEIKRHSDPNLIETFPGGVSYCIRFEEGKQTTWCRADELTKV